MNPTSSPNNLPPSQEITRASIENSLGDHNLRRLELLPSPIPQYRVTYSAERGYDMEVWWKVGKFSGFTYPICLGPGDNKHYRDVAWGLHIIPDLYDSPEKALEEEKFMLLDSIADRLSEISGALKAMAEISTQQQALNNFTKMQIK